jgi:hypothetical protein
MGFCKEKEKDILVWHYAASYFVQKATNREEIKKSDYKNPLKIGSWTQPYNTGF